MHANIWTAVTLGQIDKLNRSLSVKYSLGGLPAESGGLNIFPIQSKLLPFIPGSWIVWINRIGALFGCPLTPVSLLALRVPRIDLAQATR